MPQNVSRSGSQCLAQCLKMSAGHASSSLQSRTQERQFVSHPRGVDALLDQSVGCEHPFCPHGPTLLFERFFEKKESRRFFACSACRDRKQCPFFHWADQKITEEKRAKWMEVYQECQPKVDRADLEGRLKKARQMEDSSRRRYCRECSKLVFSGEWEEHQSHDVVAMVTEEMLDFPTHLLSPLEERKAQAQYFYDEKTTNFLTAEIKRLRFTHVICVGVPRIHEVLLTQHTEAIQSLLLDIDHRYAQFYSPCQFQRYNLFNSFFFDKDAGKGALDNFVKGVQLDKVMLVLDPPFGALASILGRSIRQLWASIGREVSTLFTFPYFLEDHVIAEMTSFKMLDYQIGYENHKVFRKGRANRPSAVRVFTNLSPPGLKLPKEEGYKFCRECCRYVAKDNVHCVICNTCPSKDGRAYWHCDMCQKCIKPGRVHCEVCGKCELPAHSCGLVPSVGCHICGSLQHKRKDCPQRTVVGEEAKVVGSRTRAGASKMARKRKACSSSENAKRKATAMLKVKHGKH